MRVRARVRGERVITPSSPKRMNLIRTVKRVLVETGLYERFEYSRAHRGFTRLFHPEVERSRRSRDEHHRAFLRPGSLVFDVGANLGEMSLSYLRAGCRVVAIEPDERCARILRRRFASKERFALEEVALGLYPTGNATVLYRGRLPGCTPSSSCSRRRPSTRRGPNALGS